MKTGEGGAGAFAEPGGSAPAKLRTPGTSVGSANRRKTEAELDSQADLLRVLMARCKDHGVVLNLHNHVYEAPDQEFDPGGTLKRIPDAKLGPDLNWLLRAVSDPVDFMHRHCRRMVYAHLRDHKADGAWPEAMGEGTMDYAAIGRALHEADF
jgi:sugar phosphate isomerase/epimerase